jgi:hypothetical protein
VVGVSTIVGNPEFRIAHAGVEKAPPTPCRDINHHDLSHLEGALIIAWLVPIGLRGEHKARLGVVHEGINEAHGGCLIRSREKD